MLNKAMLNTIKSLGLGAYIDNYGYNVMEIAYDEYLTIISSVNSFMEAYPNLSCKTFNDFGEESNNVDENLMVVIYDEKYWQENGLV